MLKKIGFSLLLLASAWACQNAKNTDPSVFADYFAERMRVFPFEATSSGVNDYNDAFPIDISDAYRDTIRAFYQKFKTRLAKIDPSVLSEKDRTSYDILRWEIDRGLDGLQFPDHLMPINQFWSKTLDLGQLGSGDGSQPFANQKDYDNWLRRVGHFPAWGDTAIANMRRGVAQGWVLPAALVKKVLPQLEPMFQTATTQHLFFQPAVKLDTNSAIPKAEKARLKADYTQMVEKIVKPTYRKLHDFLKNEYLPKARTSAGISAVPNGSAYYNHLIRLWTTTDMTADEVFELGQREVARIRAEMEKVKAQVGFKGDLKAFFKHVTEGEPKLRPFKTPKEVIANFNAIHERMKPQLAKLFDLTPKTAFEVRRTEAFREASASAEYVQGNVETGRAGVFYVPIPNGADYNVFQDEALFLHEAIPGHHYQVMLQAEDKNLPAFRRFLWYGAYGEGWALYTEGLGHELGLYTDPYQYFGRLGNEMHRAIRLVVDVGLHAKGWTRERAIQYDLDNEADSEANITAEIERYMAIPGQALSYKVGEQKILALKKWAMETAKDKFDIRRFHNVVLSDGCVPLSILEKKVKKAFGQ